MQNAYKNKIKVFVRPHYYPLERPNSCSTACACSLACFLARSLACLLAWIPCTVRRSRSRAPNRQLLAVMVCEAQLPGEACRQNKHVDRQNGKKKSRRRKINAITGHTMLLHTTNQHTSITVVRTANSSSCLKMGPPASSSAQRIFLSFSRNGSSSTSYCPAVQAPLYCHTMGYTYRSRGITATTVRCETRHKVSSAFSPTTNTLNTIPCAVARLRVVHQMIRDSP